MIIIDQHAYQSHNNHHNQVPMLHHYDNNHSHDRSDHHDHQIHNGHHDYLVNHKH